MTTVSAGKAAELAEPVGVYAWQVCSFPWQATPGHYILCVRATDSNGHTQPIEQQWTYHTMT